MDLCTEIQGAKDDSKAMIMAPQALAQDREPEQSIQQNLQDVSSKIQNLERGSATTTEANAALAAAQKSTDKNLLQNTYEVKLLHTQYRRMQENMHKQNVAKSMRNVEAERLEKVEVVSRCFQAEEDAQVVASKARALDYANPDNVKKGKGRNRGRTSARGTRSKRKPAQGSRGSYQSDRGGHGNGRGGDRGGGGGGRGGGRL
ncbi:keratin, type I cytoskeletal 9-like [Impatiens glandulifera]|uniref:keratin, type I cytoskeletal 9-like n=1 Tax=Impatiens glandulifera TaxID=253017 RepID=UPI001FB0774A|nr:keratin, type I cytoskeletal 9-like [Impatiens glandulifera]